MNRARRAGALALLGFGIAAFALLPASRAYTYNVTSSMPVGWYETRPPYRDVERGDTILICAPPGVASWYARRKYLERGPCAAHTLPLLKYVVALAGDDVDLGAQTLAVNGRCLHSQRTFVADRAGRRLISIPRGRYRLHAHDIWVWAPDARSLDSRYFGILDDRAVLAFARPVAVAIASPALHEPRYVPCAHASLSARPRSNSETKPP